MLINSWVQPNKTYQQSFSFRVGILAFHKTLSDKPRDPLVVAAFSLLVHNGGDFSEAMNIARRITKPHDERFPELLDPLDLNDEELPQEILDLAEFVKGTLLQMTDEHFVSQAMADYPKAPYSDLVSCVSLFLLLTFFFKKNYMHLDTYQVNLLC